MQPTYDCVEFVRGTEFHKTMQLITFCEFHNARASVYFYVFSMFGTLFNSFQMMHNLLLEEGDIVQIESISLPVATFSKFKPQCPDFLEITNQKAVLENALRNFACLTTGDLVAIKYNSKIYELCVLETKPGNAVSIIECDMNVSLTNGLTILH